MLRKRSAIVALAAVAVGATAPPTGAAVAAPVTDRVVANTIATGVAGGTAASGPVAGIQAVFGPDDRRPVAPTTDYPASATVLLTFTGGQCTGFMISERTVATAGHCLQSNGRWHTNVVAYPGHDGTTAPFGGCAAARLFVAPGWAHAPKPADDYGAVQLQCAIGRQTGWYKIGYTSQRMTGACTVTQGYRVDRPGQWTSTDYIRFEDASFLYTQHDFSPGQQGSPISYTPAPDDWCPTPFPWPPWPDPPCLCRASTVFGILSSGPYGSGPGGSNNVATRITTTAYDNYRAWI